ncbi:MAG: hypothetical protein M3Q34_03825 [bacterium]|nr:hypothetical protein [bacterium]
MKREAPSSPRILELKKRRKKVLRNRIILLVILFILLLVGLIFLSRWEEVSINQVQISGNKIIDTALIDKIVEEELDGYYVWVIPKRNFLILPETKIKNKLLTELKRLESVELSISDRKVLEVSVLERKALYTWCGPDLKFYNAVVTFDEESEKNCYFMNEMGYVFDRAPYFSGDVYFKFFGSLGNEGESPLGQRYYPETFSALVKLVEDVKSLDLKPSSLFVKEDGDIDLYLKSNTFSADANKIVFNVNSDTTKIVENLHASITTEPLKSELKKKYEDLLYIDLRFGNKVYYKFR